VVSGIICDNTPWEEYNGIHVKREDLSCPYPGPQFSKIRGVYRTLMGIKEDNDIPVPIGVLDTLHSKAGWGVAYLCNELDLPCINFYPVYKADLLGDMRNLRQGQRMSKKLGAFLIPMRVWKSAALYYRARNKLEEMSQGMGVMLPNALKIPETVQATAEETAKYTPPELRRGTWVISISSGTIAAGVIQGMKKYHEDIRFVVHMGYSRSEKSTIKYIHNMAGYKPANISVIDEGYSYKDGVDLQVPFPCNRYYDAKAWKWLVDNVDRLHKPVIFWNIGD